MPVVLLAGMLLEKLGKTGNKIEKQIEVGCEGGSWIEPTQDLLSVTVDVHTTNRSSGNFT
jgi:hypothetical protein